MVTKGGLPTLDLVFEEASGCVNVCKAAAAQREHERVGHFWVPGLIIDSCQQCKLAKGQDPSVRKMRPDYCKPKKFLEQVDGDYTTGWPESYKKKTLLFSLIDSFIGWVESYPIRYKDEAGDCLNLWCVAVGQPQRVRTDNEPALKGEDSKWKKAYKSSFIKT